MPESSADQRAEVPEGVDPTVMNVARTYDFMLGGSTNYEVDRAAVERMKQLVPEAAESAWANRGFHQRAVRWLAAEHGIRQFLDLGSGLPTQNNTHDVARSVASDARVVYVDIDPVVAAHARPLLAGVPGVAAVTGDLRRPDAVLADPELRRLIDLERPVGIVTTSVLHFVPDADDPWGMVRRYVDAAASGSWLALSHGTIDNYSDRAVSGFNGVYQSANQQLNCRTRVEVERFFEGLELVPPYGGAAPGVTWIGLWGADDPEAADDDAARALYCGVARKP